MIRRRTLRRGELPPMPLQLGLLQRLYSQLAQLRQPHLPTLAAPTALYGDSGDTHTECRMSSRKFEDLVELVSAHQLTCDETQHYAKCSICMEELWLAEYTEDFTREPEGTDHLPVRPRICPDHVFHMACLKAWLQTNPSCPLCRSQLIVLTGYQPMPDGSTMTVTEDTTALPGHETCGTLVVTFVIASGVQDLYSPLPGERFPEYRMVTFLPNNSEGQEVVRLLTVAWNRRLLFRIGLNPETGRMDRIVINGFELKTSRHGGILGQGYPDVSYMSRLKCDLKQVGIL